MKSQHVVIWSLMPVCIKGFFLLNFIDNTLRLAHIFCIQKQNCLIIGPMQKTLLIVVTKASYFFTHRLALAQNALKRGWRVVVCCDGEEQKERFIAYGLEYVFVPFHRSSINPVRDVPTLLALFSAYKRFKPHYIHHVALKAIVYGSFIARLCFSNARIINAYAGLGYTFISSSLKARIIRGVMICGLKLWGQGRRIHNLVQNSEDQVMIQALLSRSFCLSQPGVGVDLETFYPKNSDASSSLCRVVLPARMLQTKGVDIFIEAIKHFAHTPTIAMTLAGPYDPQNPDFVDYKTLQEVNTFNNAQWLGAVQDMTALFQENDIVVLPSHREGCPKALLEAMACGKAIITTDVAGCRDLYDAEMENMMLIPPNNPEALIKAITFLCHNPLLRKKMGEKNRALAEKKYNAYTIADKVLDHYTEASLWI